MAGPSAVIHDSDGEVDNDEVLATLRNSIDLVFGHIIWFQLIGVIGTPDTLSAKITPSSFFAVDR